MRDKIKGIVLGIIIGTILVPTVSATIATVTKELAYNDIKISLNGSIIEPADANGNVVEPFIIDGTTYLPVRSVADALGLNVEWNSESNTVILGGVSKYTSPGTVIHNKDGIKITYTGTKKDDYSVDIQFLIENNADKTITIQSHDEFVNGYGFVGIMSEDVKPGEQINAFISFPYEDLEGSGIFNIEEIECRLNIIDEATWDSIAMSDVITIAP